MRHGALILALVAVVAVGCGGGSSATDGGSDGPFDALQFDAPLPQDGPDAAPVGHDCGLSGPRPDGAPWVPTSTDVEFAAVNPLPTGEQILFNDWSPSPNKLYSMTPDGQTVTEVFRAYRIWSMGVSRARDKIAFASGYDLAVQDEHYAIPTLGDAIQHTFIYDVATQAAQVLTYGNIDDECHAFGPNDTSIYVARRYDYQQAGCDADGRIQYTDHGYRIGRIDLPGGAFTFLTPEADLDLAMSPQPTADGTALFYGRDQISGGTQTRTIMKMALPAGTTELWMDQASFPVLSPDGTRLAYQNWDDQYTLYVANLDGSQALQLANRPNFSEAVFSPDGTQVAYLPFQSAVCYIEVVKVDGTEANAPRCLRPASVGNEFITELDWITR